jgi:hypothetical protein
VGSGHIRFGNLDEFGRRAFSAHCMKLFQVQPSSRMQTIGCGLWRHDSNSLYSIKLTYLTLMRRDISGCGIFHSRESIFTLVFRNHEIPLRLWCSPGSNFRIGCRIARIFLL